MLAYSFPSYKLKGKVVNKLVNRISWFKSNLRYNIFLNETHVIVVGEITSPLQNNTSLCTFALNSTRTLVKSISAVVTKAVCTAIIAIIVITVVRSAKQARSLNNTLHSPRRTRSLIIIVLLTGPKFY